MNREIAVVSRLSLSISRHSCSTEKQHWWDLLFPNVWRSTETQRSSFCWQTWSNFVRQTRTLPSRGLPRLAFASNRMTSKHPPAQSRPNPQKPNEETPTIHSKSYFIFKIPIGKILLLLKAPLKDRIRRSRGSTSLWTRTFCIRSWPSASRWHRSASCCTITTGRCHRVRAVEWYVATSPVCAAHLLTTSHTFVGFLKINRHVTVTTLASAPPSSKRISFDVK